MINPSSSNGVKNVAILGSTGSIGRSTLEVIRHLPGFQVIGLSGHSNCELLAAQAREFQPKYVVATDENAKARLSMSGLSKTQLLEGADALERLAADPEVDIVVAAIVGIAGLPSTWAALAAGKTVALANKETLVVAGELMTRLAAESGATILPVDSEHSAVFQVLNCGNRSEVRKVVLTASGGPFREYSKEQLQQVTVEQALDHPTWHMGPKISVDSATMMNKSLEIIEARWLFHLKPEQIGVVIHPQSIVHSLVEFQDGSTIAQLSPPDMKLPIQYALTWPDRVVGTSPRLELSQALRLDFQPPDLSRFPALQLGFEAVKWGGTSGAVLNAANEAAVALFLNREIEFTEIATACREVLEQHHFEPHPTLDQLRAADQWARREISKWMVA